MPTGDKLGAPDVYQCKYTVIANTFLVSKSKNIIQRSTILE